MKKVIPYVLSAFLLMPSFSNGYNVNFGLDFGISDTLFGSKIDKTEVLCTDLKDFREYANYSGFATADIVLSENMSIEAGIEVQKINLNYTTIDDNDFGNGDIHISYSSFQIPVMFKYTIPLHKSTELIDCISIAAGLYSSLNINTQTYKDKTSTYAGNFLKPIFNLGMISNVSYSHKLGSGRIFCGLKTEFDFIPHSYSLIDKNVSIGNRIYFAPMIGYTFVIKEDKELSKKIEKNKRIKDMTVD